MVTVKEKKEVVEVKGIVLEALPGSSFLVELEHNHHRIFANPSGRMRRNNIRILPGDRILLEISPYDINRGRIIYRYK
jgi:translation initiation factor IF-1